MAEPRRHRSRHQDLVARAGKSGRTMATRPKSVKSGAVPFLCRLRTKGGTRRCGFAYTEAMSRLDSAKTRFTAALDKLETALARRAVGPRLDESLARELSGLKEDRARLAAELERLNGEKVALEGFTDEVAGRLEGAIREIRAVLSH